MIKKLLSQHSSLANSNGGQSERKQTDHVTATGEYAG